MQFTVRQLLTATLLIAALLASVLAYNRWLRIHHIDSVVIDQVIMPLDATLTKDGQKWAVGLKESIPRRSNVILQLSTKARNNNGTSCTFSSVLELVIESDGAGLRITPVSVSNVVSSGFAGLRFVPVLDTGGLITYHAQLCDPAGGQVASKILEIEFSLTTSITN